MSQSIEALENQSVMLRSSLSALAEQGATAEELDQLRTQIALSRNNYWAAVSNNLQDDDSEITNLVTQLDAQQASIGIAINQLGNVSKVIDVITKAVDIGSQIVAKATAL